MEKSITKIVNRRNALLKELAKIKIAIEVDKEATKRLSEKAKTLFSELEEIEKLFKENATFSSTEFSKFIRMVFILTEEKYALTKLTNKKTKTPYYIISDFVTRDFLFEKVYTDSDLNAFIKNHPENTIVLEGDITYPFKTNTKMIEQFARHKRLKESIYQLIQLKLDNPEISDEERFKQVLGTVLNDNLRNSYISSTQKSQ